MKLGEIEVGMRLEYIDDARYPAGTGFSRPPQWVSGQVVRAKGEGELPTVPRMARQCDGDDFVAVARDLMLPRVGPLDTGQGVKAAKLKQVEDEDEEKWSEPAIPSRVTGLNDAGYRAVLIRMPWDVLAGVPVRNGVVRCGSSKGASLGKVRSRAYGARQSEPKQASLF